MDHQAPKRPQRQAAVRPKSYAQCHGTRRVLPSTQSRSSPPNSNARTAVSPAAASQDNPPLEPEVDPSSEAESTEHETDDVSNMAAEPSTPLTQRDECIPVAISANLDAYFKNATESFQRMIKNAVDSFIEKLDQLETNLGASIEFERKRVDDILASQSNMEKKMANMEKEITELQTQIKKNIDSNNKSERFLRRNNIRIVGIPEASQRDREDCVVLAEEILRTKFNVTTKVERAHRDGRKVDDRPRHVLVKLLSYRDKVEVMRRAREILKNEKYFMIDDHTQADLQEKKKWSQQVQHLYKNGTKLKFFAGKWRQTGGTPYNFE